jgi:uncharacterized protein YbjT (DUF2867 family)
MSLVSFSRLALLSSLISFTSALSVNPTPVIKVLVTGASGKTGQLVLDQLIKRDDFVTKAWVRSEASAKKLLKRVPHCGLETIVVGDVTQISQQGIPEGLGDLDALIICTSAVPVISKLSLFKQAIFLPVNLIRKRKPIDFRRLQFGWKHGQYPELVDYEGQLAQIEMAKKLGIQQIVLVSSMGTTDPNNFLNSVGKKPDGTGHGDILLWKKKAEDYLIQSGLDYTIIHPGGLLDTPGGQERIILNTGDKLMEEKKKSISRADVASLCVAALTVNQGRKVCLDCISHPMVDPLEPVTTAEEVLRAYLPTTTQQNYSRKAR